MSFSKRLRSGQTLLAVLVGGGLLASPAIAGAWTFDATLGVWRDQSPAVRVSPAIEAKPRAQLAQAKTKAPLPTPMVERTPSNVEIVNKSINPGASDPNVPLPRADLSDGAGPEPQTSSSAPRIYGRGEEGGAVLGLRVPIPADRNAAGATARYGAGQAGPESGQEVRGR
jgi:hypothetical protein